MYLDQDQQDQLKQYIDDIIGEYSEQEFEAEKLHMYIFALFEQSQTLNDFTDLANGELKDILTDNTENFVNDLTNYIEMNIDIVNDAGGDTRISRMSSHAKRDDDDDRSDADDDAGDDDDDEKDTNYRRRRKQSDDEDDEPEQKPRQLPPHQQPQHNQNDRKKNYDKNQHQNRNDNRGGNSNRKDKHNNMPNQKHDHKPPHEQQKHPVPGFPPGNQFPPQPYPQYQPQPGMQQSYMHPQMWNQQYGQYYPQPQPGYAPPGYPQQFNPYDQHQHQHQPGHMPVVQPPQGKPEPKKPEYDPLNQEQKKPPPQKQNPNQAPQQHHPKPNNSNNNNNNAPKDYTGQKRGPQKPLDNEETKTHKVHVGEKDGNHHTKSVTPANMPHDGSKKDNTIYIKNIPDYYNNLDALNKQFKKFGPITNIKVDLKNKFTTIEFLKPKHAKAALSNKSPLFGNKDILVTADPNATLEDEAKTTKLETVLMDRLKFLIAIKKFIQEHHRPLLVNLIDQIKKVQKSKEVTPPVQDLINYEVFDLGVDFSLVVSNVDFAQKATMQKNFESRGKIENFKPNPKEKSIEVKYFDIKDAQRAKTELGADYNVEFRNDKIVEFIEKIENFEDFLILTKKKEEDQSSNNASNTTNKNNNSAPGNDLEL